MKFASGAWRIKQMGHSAPDNRANNTEQDCPRDRQMRMHECLGDTTHEEPNKDIPDEVKHVFLFNFCDLEINPAIAKFPIRSHAKEMTK
jgi:hypothetical protein